jgi:hypothetical protein
MTSYTYIDQSLEEIIKDLSEYTKIPTDVVRNLVMNRQPYCYKREFVEKKLPYNDFYNLASSYFIFGNAKHGTYIDDITKLVDYVCQDEISFFEFGGGCGSLSIAAKDKFRSKMNVSYNELSVIQKDFFNFRCYKKNLSIRTVGDWLFNEPDDEFIRLLGLFDIVVALDVLEHIEDYPKYLNKICKSIRINGYLWEGSYFLENQASDPCHNVEDKWDYKKIIKSHGFELQSEPKMSEGNLWRKNGTTSSS